MATQNDPRTQADLLRQFPQLLVIDNTTQNPRQKSLALPRIPFRQIGCHTEAEDPVAQELQFLVIVFPQRQTILRSLRQNSDFIGRITSLLPQLGAIYVGLMYACLGEQLEIRDPALPAIPLKNRDRIRRSELPILWIPRTKCLDNYITATAATTVTTHLVYLEYVIVV